MKTRGAVSVRVSACLLILATLTVAVGLAVSLGDRHTPLPPGPDHEGQLDPEEQLNPEVGAAVDALFADFQESRFPQMDGVAYFGGGWRATLPDGEVVESRFLQAAAQPVIDLGEAAIPRLRKWARHDNKAVAYMATYSLEQIKKGQARDWLLHENTPRAP